MVVMRRYLAVAVLALAVGSCAKAPLTAPIVAEVSTTPAAVYADFSGVSVMTYKMSVCQGLRECWYRTGATVTSELRLLQTGNTMTGLFIESAQSVIPVTGQVSGDGELTLAGARARVSRSWSMDAARAVTLRLRRGADGAVTGTVEIKSDTNHYEQASVTTGGDIAALTPVQPLAAQAGFTGTWSGQYIIRSCTVVGFQFCAPVVGELYGFDLTLSGSGSSLTGELQHLAAVTGSGSGDQLTLGGRSIVTVPAKHTITGWQTYRDALGQLHGTFTFLYESGAISRTIEAELYFVTHDIPGAQALKK